MKLWKKLVGLFFLLVIVDGALRKWVLPSFETALLLLKDVVLWGGFLSYAWSRDPFELPRPLRSTWVPLFLVAYISVVLLQAFNLRQPSLMVSAIGVKAHLAYLPLVVLLPPIIAQATEEQVVKFTSAYAAFVYIPILALCVYQFFQPATAWVNQYVREMATVAKVQEYVRVTGTFSYIGSLTPYLKFNGYLGGAILLAGVQWSRRRLTILGGVILAGTAVVLPMAGGRGPVLLVIGGLVALFLIVRSQKGTRLKILSVTLLFAVVVGQGVGGNALLEGWDALIERAERAGTEEAERRTVGLLLAPIEQAEEAGLFGYGVGTNHQAATRFVAASGWEGRLNVENGVQRIIMELGLLGWGILMALKTALLYIAFRAVRRSQSPVELIISATGFCMLLSNILLPVVFRLVRSALYWGTAGAVLGIWSLQEVRRESRLARSQRSKTTVPF
ncbi:hypothetical protein GGP84_003176 [Salinibacter ruber]|uniref:O-antigen ligase family protein n=1 Tax=Salinibacter ruber TaxID=146919 RepID=UPI0021696541|nr:hypothetical protein [Salinibacter ruber]MCS3940524.1 hypothetical protein [Salinibacter ruber]